MPPNVLPFSISWGKAKGLLHFELADYFKVSKRTDIKRHYKFSLRRDRPNSPDLTCTTEYVRYCNCRVRHLFTQLENRGRFLISKEGAKADSTILMSNF